MSFKPCIPDSRTACGVHFGFAVRHGGADKKALTLQIVIHARSLRTLKWSNGDLLRLDYDPKARLARLMAVQTSGSKAARKLHVSPTGRGAWSIRCTGEVRGLFGAVIRPMTPLTIVEESSEGLIFEYPDLKAEG